MVSTWLNEVQGAGRLGNVALPMLRSSNANDYAGAPLGFGDVLFSAPEKVASAPVFAPLQDAPVQEAFLA
jgi:hypothetical protein